ncbi:MAG: hypothetical protein JWN76_2241 [Chitinophagaceae bacterium]|nr:hypothetical protein [Chitinophagaceae bacterium]
MENSPLKIIDPILEDESKQAMLAAIVDSSDDAIISKTLNGIITSWNFGAQKIFGYTEAEVLGKSILILLPPERISEENVIIGKIRKGERIEHFETVRVAKDGHRLHISLTVSPIKNSKGEVIGASKIARDISERIEIEAKLKDFTEQLQKLNRHKDEFIGMASHELKTPLTSITAYLQLLERNLKDDKNKKFADKALQHVNKLTNLVGDLLDVSKIESGKLQLTYSEFDINILIKETIEIVQHITRSHTIIFDDEEQPVTIMADRQRIEQVLINLLTNAVKYSPHSEKVIVSVKRESDGVIVSVQDYGFGISDDQAQKIFSRFYRVEGLAANISGLGIGLFICYEIIERHHGKIWVDSQLGIGSTFNFSLPYKQL